MNYNFARITKSTYVAIISLVLLLSLAIYTTLTPKVQADQQKLAANEHIITVHDDTEPKGFITKKATLREALTEAGIVLDQNDRTEPELDTQLTESSYHVNIYRARTVAVKDGAQVTKLITSYRTARQIAQQAGIAVRSEDILTLAQSNSPIRDGASEVLSIKRAVEFNFDFYGKQTKSYTQATTVGAMLAEKGIKMSNKDVVVPDVETKISAGMDIRLYRNGKQTVTVEEDVPFSVERINDASKNEGFEEVKTAGQNGRRQVTYEIVIENGVETARSEVNSNIITQPVNEVKIVGTKINLPPGSHTDWMAAAGIAESDFGYVNFIIAKESTWRVNAVNGQYYGLYQTTKANLASHGCVGETLHDPICQLRSASIYKNRYGTWADAYNAWKRQGWW